MTVALKVKERFLRRCRKRGIFPMLSQSRGVLDPIVIVFWRAGRDVRVLHVLVDGSMMQGAGPYVTSDGEYTLSDEHKDAIYERWFWFEMKGAAHARRLGLYEHAHEHLRLARRFRRYAEAARAPEPIPYLQAAE